MEALWQLRQFFVPFKHRIALSILLGFLTVAASVGLMATSGYLIASAALHPATILLLWVPIVGVRFFGLSRAVFRYLERIVSHDLTFRMLARLRVWLYERLEPAAPTGLQSVRGGDVLSSLTSDVDTLQNFYLRVFAPPVVAALTIAFVFALVSHWSLRIAWTLAGLLLVAGVAVPLLTLRLGHKSSSRTVTTRAALYTDVVDSIQGMTELISFNQVEQAVQRIAGQQAELNTQHVQLSHVSGMGMGLATFIQNFAAWAMLWLAIPLVSKHQLSGVNLTALVLTALASFEAVAPLPTAFQSFGQTKAAAKRVFRLASTRPLLQDNHNQSQSTPFTTLLPTHFDLSINALSFRYPDTEQLVLEDLSFVLPHGKHLAIVGQSGSGKSTLASLLVRLWDYQGSVRLGGQELSETRFETVRNLISIVPQQPYLFHTSIAENLRIAKPDATHAELQQALQLAQLQSLLERLPDGLETLVGEQGATLSGGEHQRIALARCFLQSSPILVLDEPTTGLDAITEQQMMATLLDATENRSLILITHRLLGLETMDEILVMKAGRIVERGTHDELLSASGLYRSMWDLEQQRIG